MTLTDRPGRTALTDGSRRYRMKTSSLGEGGDPHREVITALSSRSALGPSSVVMRDFDWHRSRTVLEGRAEVRVSQPFLAEHFEFPARDEAVHADPCMAPATYRLERLAAERRLSSGRGHLPSAEAGTLFTLLDDSGQHEEGELLLTAVETTVVGATGSELAWQILGLGGTPPRPGLQTRFEVLPDSILYRPAMRTPKPRVAGLHTALVTAEEADVDAPPEIHADPHGRVRLRFPWDTTAQDGTPSSDWVRVAQAWAGSGFGALYVPRVGHEVLVSYEQGDPDRPIVVGGVYNTQAPPPYDPQRRPTVSTLRSEASPGGGGHNELRFEDRAGHEEIFLHAQRNLREVVGATHSTQVGASQTISVGAGQSVSIGAGQSEQVGAGRDRSVGAGESVRIGEGQTLTIGASRQSTVGDADELVVERGDRTVETTLGKQVFRAPAGKIVLEAGSARLEMESGRISLDNGAGATVDMVADLISVDTGAGSRLQLFSNGAYLKASLVSVDGEIVTDIKGGVVKLNC